MKKIFLMLLVLAFTAITVKAQHTIVLKSGEKMSGQVNSMNAGIIKFDFKGNEMSFKVSEVSSIQFDGAAGGTAVSASNASTTKGVSYVMAGRKITKEPKIDNLTMEKGVVVVEISINKYGNVIKAVPGIEGSTTTSKYLHTKAQQAAQSVMFDTSPIMPLEQKGTITITF